MKRTHKVSVFEIISDSSLTGAPRHLYTLVSHLNRYQFSTSVICPPGPLVTQLKKLKVPVFTVPMEGRADLNAINAIQKLLRKYQPDIIHTHGQRGGLIGRMAARGLPVKVVHTEHTFTRELRYDNPVLMWAHLNAMRVLDRNTNVVIAVSEAVRKYLIETRISKPAKIITIHNGTDLAIKTTDKEVAAARFELGIAKSDLVIGTVGSFNRSKDTATLIKAFAKVHARWPKTKLVLIGSGELKAKLENLVDELSLAEVVIFTGSLPNPFPLMRNFNLFVLPSVAEPFGLVLLEAMRLNLPIVATQVGGIPEIIKHNYNGMLVPAGDAKKLSATMLKILNDKKLQKKLTQHYPEVLKQFSAAKMTKATEKVYLSLVG